MKISKLFLVALISSVFFVSCSSDDNNGGTPLGTYDNGVLILNQGGFGAGNASVSYVSDDFVTQQNNIYGIVNPSLTLGDTGQDIGFYENLAFIVLNASNKIEIVNRYSMLHVGTINEGLDNPRYITFSNGKGFVTNWGDGTSTTDDFIAVINLETYLVSSTIPVVEGPERIIAKDGKLYVAHAGGYNYGSSITVLNAANNTITTSIVVGDVPNSLEIEGNSLYVISGGKPSWTGTETAGKLSKINLSNNAVTSISFPEGDHPSNLEFAENSLYYTVDSEVFKSTLNATTLPAEALFSTTAQGVYGVYSFAVKNNKIYVGDAVDYSSNGKVYIYSATGTLEKNYTVGVIPAGFYFN
ncbi:YncE family protein [Flavobacterium sp.]